MIIRRKKVNRITDDERSGANASLQGQEAGQKKGSAPNADP